MKKYMAYLDDGHNCIKVAIPADSVRDAKKYVEGNGEVIKVTDVTENYPISAVDVHGALLNAGFGEPEMDFIVRALQRIGIIDAD